MINITDINPYCATITDLTTYVVISNVKVALNWDNKPSVLPIPTTAANRGSTTPEAQTIIINLLKLTKTFKVDGHLTEGKLEYESGTDETKTTAKLKKGALEDLIESGSTLTLIYEGVSRTGVITKMEITETARDVQSSPNDGDIVYDVSIAFVVGVDKISSS